MKADERRQTAIRMVTQAQANMEPEKVTIRHEVPEIFDGHLLIVTMFSRKENRYMDNFIFFEDDDSHYFYNTMDLARFLDTRRPHENSSHLAIQMLSIDRIPAILAIIITMSICYLVVFKQVEKPPETLGNALSIILGFYFGSKVNKDGNRNTGGRVSTGRPTASRRTDAQLGN